MNGMDGHHQLLSNTHKHRLATAAVRNKRPDNLSDVGSLIVLA
jgi:hypothetical protein